MLKAATDIETEVIVVDNHSTDDSLVYLRPKFPSVNFIQNETNSGFGKACNRGLWEASGQYILFLNPDTIVAEDTFSECIRFFQTHPACGAVGVKMIDGSGAFLKESKRAFPSPMTSLFKLSGLSHVFPKSGFFARYHLGHLDKEKNHEVDVLAGAYLMTTKTVLNEAGAFDEAFFMYGEDIDLSYRIQKQGYKNYYVADTSIIHFKGESTKRGSFNYVLMFYRAMSIFVNKHYGGTKAAVFRFSIRLAIWLRAFIAALLELLKGIGLPVIDAALILFSIWTVKECWAAFIRTGIVYPDKLLLVSFPLFTLLYLVAAYYAGLYDKFYKRGSVARSTVAATITLLSVYALLPEQYRFSRGIVVFGAVLAFLLISIERRLMLKAAVLSEAPDASLKPHILIAAPEEEYKAVESFLKEKGFGNRIIGRIGINGAAEATIAHLSNVESTAEALAAKELVFCAGKLSYKEIIALTERLQTGLKFRYHAFGSGSIVGSDTSTQSGEVLSAETDFGLARPSAKRLKRLVDAGASLLFLLSFPLAFFLVEKPLLFFANCFSVLAGKKTWVGYRRPLPSLPPLRKSVLAPNGKKGATALSSENLASIDYWYARNYEPRQDLKIVFANYRWLGSADTKL